MITTRLIPARMSGWMGRMVGIWFDRWWWLAALLIGVPLVLGVLSRPEWLLVALMIALIGYPGLLWWIYVQYGLRSEGLLAMLPRQVSFGNDALTIAYTSTEDDGERVIVSVTTVPYASITRVATAGRALLIEWGSDPWAYISVPYASFRAPGDANAVMNRLAPAA